MPAAIAATAIVLLLSGCGAEPVTRTTRPSMRPVLPATWPAVEPADPEAARATVMRALSLVGTPYKYGGDTPETGFDCSGLIHYVFRDMLARTLPRRSVDLANAGADVPLLRMAAGDLVVFGTAGVDHVGIYIGEGRFVHAPTTGGSVRLDRLDGPYWRERLLGARRLLQ
ncbi:C40 family peptidase [Lysobacter humi (ex Lee et al. 2017)]